MARNIIFVLMYHRHELLDLIYFIFLSSNLRYIGELHLGCDALRYDTSLSKIRRNILNPFSESKS
jgi:hypothetical protein